MPTYRLLIEYDGTRFSGWQMQPNQPTIQDAIEQALATVLRVRPNLVGSGRTDAGVHARGQVAHFRIDRPTDPFRLRRALNGLLPADVAVLAVDDVPDAFHARFDARRRRYRYYVTTAPRALERRTRLHLRPVPDFGLMRRATADLVGTHDFDAFCRVRSATEDRVCTVEIARWIYEVRAGDAYFEIAADRFVHGMVRTIVGTLLEMGRGLRPGDDIARVLATRDRREAGETAPAHGLVLEAVEYDELP
jgi:tRNA pseudouridine38-40 synthase